MIREGNPEPVDKYFMLFSDVLLESTDTDSASEWGCDVEVVCLLSGAKLVQNEDAGNLSSASMLTSFSVNCRILLPFLLVMEYSPHHPCLIIIL